MLLCDLFEGTWSLPDTISKKQKLKKILSKPLKAKDASKILNDLVGDDRLFDLTKMFLK